ncbi:MAG: hypothetical protein AAGK00_14125 [Pseudomonadota bacterium]
MRWSVWGRLAALVSVSFLAACDERGFSGLQNEWDRRHQGPYYVVNASHDRAVISALGHQVAIEPAKGFCLAEDSIETTGRSAFALIGDCVLEDGGDQGTRGEKGELYLPRGVPGIITVSVSGDPGFGAIGDPLGDFSEYLETAEGRRLLGRSGDGARVQVLESRRIGEAVYVLVEDGGDPVVPVLASTFWRAFTSLNNRLTVVTVSGFNALPLGNEVMLRYLVDQVQTLATINDVPVREEPETRLARGEPNSGPGLESVPVTDLVPTAVIVAAATEPEAAAEQDEYSDWPLPPERPRRAGAGDPPAPETPGDTAATEPEAELPGTPETDVVEPAERPVREAETPEAPEVDQPQSVTPEEIPVAPATPETPDQAPALDPALTASAGETSPEDAPTVNAPEEAPEAPLKPKRT